MDRKGLRIVALGGDTTPHASAGSPKLRLVATPGCEWPLSRFAEARLVDVGARPPEEQGVVLGIVELSPYPDRAGRPAPAVRAGAACVAAGTAALTWAFAAIEVLRRRIS